MEKLLFLIAGTSSQGKSVSLMNLRNPEGVFYLGTEANKPLPFPDKFKKLKSGLNDPKDIFTVFEEVEKMDDVHTVVIDSITFLMDMYETFHIYGAVDSRAEWGNYQQFFKRLMQETVTKSSKNWIFIGHNSEELQGDGTYKYYVPVKGALAKQGLESYFSIVVYARRVKIDYLEEHTYDPELLRITERERHLGYKHVFQCDVTKEMPNSRIRAPIGCFSHNQIFMDNDAQLLIDHLGKYYGISSS